MENRWWPKVEVSDDGLDVGFQSFGDGSLLQLFVGGQEIEMWALGWIGFDEIERRRQLDRIVSVEWMVSEKNSRGVHNCFGQRTNLIKVFLGMVDELVSRSIKGEERKCS